jgi:hypothetical protein
MLQNVTSHMSQEGVLSESISLIDEDEWIELEIPARKIKEKWDDRYKDELIDDTKRSIKKDVLSLYSEIADIEGDIYEKKVAVEKIIDKNEDLARNLCAVTQFSKGLNIDLIKECYSKIEESVDGTDLQPFYGELEGSRVGMVALIHFTEPGVLRDIHSLDYCYGKTPKKHPELTDDSSLNIFEDSSQEIIDYLESSDRFRDYRIWHHFDHQDSEYLLIMRQISDDVERQASGNIEEEPAKFIVLRKRKGNLEIIAESKKTASRVQRGFDDSIDHISTIESVETMSRSQVSDVISDFEYMEDRDDIDDGEKPDVLLISIFVSESPFPNQPSIKLKSKEGIMPSLKKFRELNHDLTDHPENIERFTVECDEKEFTIIPSEVGSDDEIGWILRYNARSLTDDERENFEARVREATDIDLPLRLEQV